MIPVGIHENVGFSAKINDKGTLVITAAKVISEEEMMAALMSSEASTDASTGEDTQNFMIFPLQLKGYENGVLMDVRSPKAMMQDVSNLKAFLSFILSQYTELDNIEWNPFANSDYSLETLKPKDYQNIEFLDTVYKNLTEQFVRYMNEYGDGDKPFRVVFVRSSKKSHYPKLRSMYVSSNPFMEPMEIPVEQSKIAFTKGELAAGLDSGEQLVEEQSAADKDTSSLGDAGL